MSGVDKPNVIDSGSGANFYSNVQLSDKIQKPSESQSIIINFYSSNQSPKSDKVVQTEHPLTGFNKARTKIQEIVSKKRESSGPLLDSDSEDSEDDYPSTLRPKSTHLFSHERKLERSMEARKQGTDNKPVKGGVGARTTSDLERKKLEAELKAAEEIAKLKESIIEKRLALELVSIQDGNERHQKMALTHPSPPHPELRNLEEIALKKQALIESNLSQELQSLELQNRLQPPRPPTTPSGPSRQPSLSGKMNAFRTDSSSSVLNSVRNVSLIERKFNLDKNFGGHLNTRSTSPSNFFSPIDSRFNDSRFNDSRSRTEEKQLGYPRQEVVYNSTRTQTNTAQSVWKTMVAKIKKKIKSPRASSSEWNDYPNERQRGR